MENIIYLDLTKVTLYGWEREKSSRKVKKMERKARRRKDFPAVPVKEVGPNQYSLLDYYDEIYATDGGHHRAISHYRAGVPLKCKLVDWVWGRTFTPERGAVDIKEIKLVAE